MIRLSTAQKIAAKWHGGQTSALYKLCSSGHISEDVVYEINSMLRDLKRRKMRLNKTDSKELKALVEFIYHYTAGTNRDQDN